MRGKHASKPIEDVVAEAEELVADGAKELVIVAQDTTFYGMDIYGKPRLDELLRRLEQVDGVRWIRLMYFYPMYITDELLDVIAASEKILPYIDIPLQHIDDDVLRRMRRATTRDKTEQLLDRLRARIPESRSADDAHRRLSRRDGRAIRPAAGVRPAAEVRAAGGVRLQPRADHAVRRDGRPVAGGGPPRPPRPAFGGAAGGGLRLEPGPGRAADGRDSRRPGARPSRRPSSAAPMPTLPRWTARPMSSGEGLAAGQIVSCEIVAAKGYDLIGVAN